jgi:hypothetical protein
MYPSDQIEAIRGVYGAGVQVRSDGQDHYVYIPELQMPQGCIPERTDALFCVRTFAPTCGGYTSRLFLKDRVASPHTPNNYNPYLIAAETWYAYSHNNVQDGPYLEMILNHLRGLLAAC